MFNHEKLQTISFIALAAIIGFAAFLVFKPFITIALFSVFLAVAIYPVYNWILKKNKERRTSTSVITVLLVLVVVIIPAILLSIMLLQQIGDAYSSLLNSVTSGELSRTIAVLENKVQNFVPEFHFNLEGYLMGGLTWVVSNLDRVVSGFSNTTLWVVLVSFFLYYLFIYGPSLLEKLVCWSPMEDSIDRKIINQIKLSINSVIRGYLFIALLQGLSAGLGLFIFGMPNAVILGTATAIASFIPFFGTSLIMVPSAIFMAATGHIGAAVGILLWGFFMVHLIDNFLMPYMLNKGMKMNQLMALLSVLGGLSAFGPVGFVIGPLVFGLVMVMIDIYPLMFKKNAKENC